MNKIQYNREYILDKVENFLRLYNLYDGYEKSYIMSVLKKGKFPDTYSYEMVREVLDELNLIPAGYNIYEDYLKFIKEIHDISKLNVMEVGGGVIPRLGERINLEQNSGTITVYDPRLYKEDSNSKLILKRKKVNIDTNVDGIDLIIGLMPCKGAEDLLNVAIKNNIDFVLWLCEGGPHGDCYDYFEDEDEWRQCMITIASRGVTDKQMGKLHIKMLPNYSNTFPIIYNTRN